MKNIHVIPTNKPSRLALLHDDKLHIGTSWKKDFNANPQNIYITSDEEIKEGDKGWLLENNGITKNITRYDCTKGLGGIYPTDKKIILTTDQDLIKDGVQAIDDEFLEWFVKNPSCEWVEVANDTLTVKEMSKLPLGTINHKYKIIIPQEEPKQETIEEVECNNCGYLMSLTEDESVYACYNSECTSCYEEYEEDPKQQTLSYTEAAKKDERIFNSTMMKQETIDEVNDNRKNLYFKKQVMNPYAVEEYSHTAYEKGFIEGYEESNKYQQERMYSEEEVIELLQKYRYDLSSGKTANIGDTTKFWFEQFKK
jgi:hypothetical protein